MSVTPPEQPPAEPTPPAPSTPPEAPPWGDPASFDAEKAWNLIQNLKADKAKLSERPALTPEQQSKLDEYARLEEASKTEAQRQQEAIEAANRQREEAAAEAVRFRVALEHGVGKEDLELLGSGTEEQLVARAARIAELRDAAKTPEPTPPPGRPKEQFKPGATPAEHLASDDALYQQIYGK